MTATKKQLDDEDFPVKAKRDKVVTTTKEPVAEAENEELAEDTADRLNDDAWRRHEDGWSA
jgi:hypothetical protein